MKSLFLYKLLKRKHPVSSLGTNVYRDWSVLFVVISILALALLSYSYYFFREIERGSAFIIEDIEPVGLENIDIRALDGTVSFYQKKQEQFAELEKNRPPYQDPSYASNLATSSISSL